MAVPWDVWQSKLEFRGEETGNVRPSAPQCGKRANCSAKLQDQTALLRFCQPTAMPNHGIQPSGDLYAKRRRQGVLHPGAAGNERRAMFLSECAQRLRHAVQIARGQFHRLAQLQDPAGVDGVLAGCAPMYEVRRVLVLLGYKCGEMLHQRDRQIACASRRFRQSGSVEEFRSALGGDRGGRCRWNNANACFGARQRSLKIEHPLQRGAIGKHGADGRRAEERIEKIHALSVIAPNRQRKRFPQTS